MFNIIIKVIIKKHENSEIYNLITNLGIGDWGLGIGDWAQ